MINPNNSTIAQVHKLASINKALVASQIPEVTLIPRPLKGSAGQEWNMRERMGLEDNPKLYLSIRVSFDECENISLTHDFRGRFATL